MLVLRLPHLRLVAALGTWLSGSSPAVGLALATMLLPKPAAFSETGHLLSAVGQLPALTVTLCCQVSYRLSG